LGGSVPGEGRRCLGLDLGTARIGVALAVGRLALPLTVLTVGPRWVADVLEIADAQAVAAIVVGWPIGMSGRATPGTRRIGAMTEELRSSTSVPVVCVDERLSTRAVERRLMEAGISARARRGRVDDLAAAEILQRWLDGDDPCGG